MKILFISTLQDLWGGSEELWSKTALHALKEGHDICVLCYKHIRLPQHLRLIKDNGGHLILRPNDLEILKGSTIKRLYHRLKLETRSYSYFSKLNRFKPDVILVNQGGAFNAAEDDKLFDFITKTQVPYLLTNRLTSDNGIPELQTLDKGRALYKKAKHVIFASENNKEAMQSKLLFELENSCSLNSPLNLSNTKLVPFPIDTKTLNMACVARLDVNYKGQDILFKALATPEWLTRKWNLNLYGRGEHYEYLVALADYFGISDRIKFHGHVENISKVWQENHIMILPSLEEGLPIALLECLISGRPAIATAVAGNTEVIIDGQTGYLIKGNNTLELQHALERAWQNSSKWENMGINAHDSTLRKIDTSPEIKLLKMLTSV
ncbi:MAG: glycosyltransferase family 4 protein [Cyclobacteriaceae bacterium]